MASFVRRLLLPLAALLLVAPTGCSTTGSSGGTADAGTKPAAGQIPTGAGPQRRYTVQSQPAAGMCHYRHTGGQPLPDPACTPGALNPDVTPATINTTICRKGGYTSGIRPPANITDKEKHLNAASYGYADSLHDAEYDHLISLQLGGDPNDPRNLWVELPSPGHKPGAGPNNPKDAIETHLHTAICKGTITLTAAQHAIATNWTTAESALGIAR
ncbi:hypothetical protein [Actinoallomurus iriomotensis]|uniref:HNH endonuclease n=1 Tax=Actinoallomurus iriomotensis TaxID=478107 RepID=A0A9W6RRS9_9ACTN|nr:hypothetical protein [Actinoallomurus iriomotensis]GLY80598.1 hypothetical protein Airi01_088650 [Actinoallomurus iriomotensis]